MTGKNIAVIGAGYWGKNLVRNFSQLGVLKIICDGALPIRKQMAEAYPDVMVTDDIKAILNDNEIEGVVIAAPAALHFEIAEKVLHANKNAFVEKPLSLTYSDGERLVRLAEDNKKIIFVGHILHYHPAVIRLKEMINAGAIGRLQYIYSRRLSLGKIRREENILWSFAPHDISLILSLVGEEPSYIDSVGHNFLHANIPDVTMTTLKFLSGIGAHIFVSWLNPFKEQRLIVVGSQGMFVFDDTQPVDQKLVFYPHIIHWKDGMPVPEKAEGQSIDLKANWEEPLKAECRAFLEAISTGCAPVTSGEEALRVLHVLEVSQKSLEKKESAVSRQKIQAIPQKDYSVHETAVIDAGGDLQGYEDLALLAYPIRIENR
jgi:UDP-2-acetamido-3-amino-2,3-dideoxy-glucuronate N-acetyltransferase